MKEFNINNDPKKGTAKSHKELLGMDVPEGYFSKSKEEILKAVSAPEKKNSRIIILNPIIKYAIAASVVILLGLTLFIKLQTKSIAPSINVNDNTEMVIMQEDQTLINSLFVDNEEIDAFLDDYVMNEIMIKAQESEMELDNMLINSLMIDDSLLDSYIDKNFVENIIL